MAAGSAACRRESLPSTLRPRRARPAPGRCRLRLFEDAVLQLDLRLLVALAAENDAVYDVGVELAQLVAQQGDVGRLPGGSHLPLAARSSGTITHTSAATTMTAAMMTKVAITCRPSLCRCRGVTWCGESPAGSPAMVFGSSRRRRSACARGPRPSAPDHRSAGGGRFRNSTKNPATSNSARAEPKEQRGRLDRRLVENEVAVARDHVGDDLVVVLPAAICSRICRRRSCASSALESAIVWFWQTRQRSFSASSHRALRRATGSGVATALGHAASGQRSTQRAASAAAIDAPHDFCSSRTSGRIFFSSASGGERPDLLVADHALLVDHEGLGHAVDAVVDADPPVAVDDRQPCRDRRAGRAMRLPSAGLSL